VQAVELMTSERGKRMEEWKMGRWHHDLVLLSSLLSSCVVVAVESVEW